MERRSVLRGATIENAKEKVTYRRAPNRLGSQVDVVFPSRYGRRVNQRFGGDVMKKRLNKKTLEREALLWKKRKNAQTRDEVKACLK
ncbi:MAG: hypothetical protein CVU64_09555 [Deltaproteobacteria bacterium HGW-Deltaproteobacteria-21]|nr:MAG: hypothetical protein CVU64_09555 [Deltaproteobacteria bacterium HGW-Deltaproteobacteria-21]